MSLHVFRRAFVRSFRYGVHVCATHVKFSQTAEITFFLCPCLFICLFASFCSRCHLRYVVIFVCNYIMEYNRDATESISYS